MTDDRANSLDFAVMSMWGDRPMDSVVPEQKVLSGNIGRTYTLLDLLGDGLTAQVFRAQADNPDEVVAVKVLRPGLEESIVKRFEIEHRTLAAVWEALRAAAIDRTGATGPNGLDDSPATPPQSFEFCPAKPEQPAFMAMELMPDRKVELLLAEYGAFAELSGLRLGLQLFGLLHILHVHMKRSYDDFKFENLWWEAETLRLRVTDWNVLGEEKNLAGKVPWDLERGARALLRVLTGVPLRPELRLDQQQRWNQLSFGAQALLKRMLDVDKDRRLQSADEICRELRLLIGYWLIEPGRGLRNAEAALDGIAEGHDAATMSEETLRRVEPTVRQTRAALSVLHLRQQQEAATGDEAWPTELALRLDGLQARAEQYAPSPGRMVSTALTLMQGHSFPAAAAKLRDAVQLFPDHLSAHRWLELAEAMAAGKALAVGENSRWQNAIRSCDASDFDMADVVLANLPVQFAVGLRGEVAVHQAVKRAQSNSVQTEAKLQAVRQARTALAEMRKNQQVTYASAVQEGLGIDLETWEKSLKEQAEAEQRQAQVTAEVSEFNRHLAPLSLEKGVERAEKRLYLFLDEPTVVDVVLRLGEKCLEAKQYHLAARAFYTGAVLEHDRAPAFRLRWLVARAAYLRSTGYPEAKGEVERAENAIKDARRRGIEAGATLDVLWKPLELSGQLLDTALFADTLKDALVRDEKGVLAVIGEQLDASRLASALDGKLKTLDPSKLDSKTRMVLDGLVQTHAGLSPAVLSLLQEYNKGAGRSLSKAKDEGAAQREIAKVIGMPHNTQLVEVLLRALPADERVHRANSWGQMASRCSAGPARGTDPKLTLKAATDIASEPSLTPNENSETPPAMTVDASAPSASLSETVDLDRIMEALNSNDPRQWQQTVNMPENLRGGWPPEVRRDVQQLPNKISLHKRDLDLIFGNSNHDPVAVKERFQDWRRAHQQLVSCWDPRKQDWVAIDALELEVQHHADTWHAKEWLGTARRKQDANEPLDAVIGAARQGLQFVKADPGVLIQLKKLIEQLENSIREVDLTAPLTASKSEASSVIPPELRAMLERPILESRTLTELYYRLQDLMQTKTAYDSDISERLDGLRTWTEKFEAVLTVNEDLLHSGRPLAPTSITYASNRLNELAALAKSEYWKPYIPKSQETVFTLTKKRLEAIKNSQRPVTYHSPQR